MALAALSGTSSRPEETLQFGRFGRVTLYNASPKASRVVLFVSGDGGWNLGVVDMARDLATLDALVVGIDIKTYLKNLESSSEKCSYVAGDFESLSQFVQKKLDFPTYVQPVLCGYSSGATLVYATLVQAPTGTFQGAISLGFCPDLPLVKPLCRGSGLAWKAGPKGKGYSFEPSTDLETPWVALQGTVDQVCDPAATESYVRQVRGAEIVMLPKVGHGFSVPKNWMPQFRQAFAHILGAEEEAPAGAAGTKTVVAVAGSTGPSGPASDVAQADVAGLPLVEVPAAGQDGDTLAVIVSGDGGWAGLDREVSKVLAGQGVAVVGLNSLQYFWTRRTPDGAAEDLARILRHYLAAWHREKLLLIGYSRGADVLPFMANRLPADLLSRVSLVALLGPAHAVDFQIHLTDWLGGAHAETALPVLPEVQKLKGVRLVCIYGEDESDTICPGLDPSVAKPIRLSGGHHFGGEYAGIAAKLLEEAR